VIEPCRCVYPDKCFCTPEQKREALILRAMELREQGRYDEAAVLTQELRAAVRDDR